MRALPVPLRRLLWWSGALYVLYLIAGNVLLNLPRTAAVVNSRPQAFHAQWASAWTLWPGDIHMRDLRLRGQVHRLRWSARGASASGSVRWWPLLRRELRFGPLRADAVTLDVQPARSDLKPPPFQADAWRITVERIDTASLRQIRVGALVLDGKGTAAIGFTHQLTGGASAVFPSRVAMSGARVLYRARELLHDARFEVQFAFDPFTYEQPPGWQKLERARIHVVLAGATPAIALGADPAGALAATLSTLGGHLSTDFLLDHGTLAPGGRLQWNAPVAITEADGSQQRRRGQLDLAVQPAGVLLDVRVPPAAGARAGVTPNRLTAHLEWASRRLLPLRPAAAMLPLLSGSIEGRWHFASLRWLTPLTARRPWLRLAGAGDVDGAVHIAAGRLLPGSHVEVPQVSLAAGLLDNVFAGSAHAQARVLASSGGARSVVGLTMDQFTLAPRGAPTQAYLRGHALQLQVQSSAQLTRLGHDVIAHLQFADAAVPDLRAYNRYLPGKSLRFLGGSGRMSSAFTLDGHGDVTAGRLQMTSSAARLALGVSRLSGRLSMDTRLARAHRIGHAFDLDAFTLGLDGVRVEGSSAPPWWARITLQQGRLDWDRPLRVRGRATLVMKDVSLLLSLFADRSAFPKWIANVIDDGRATARAEVEAQRGDFILDHLVASNRRVDLFAHLRIRNGKPSGDLYARWGILGLGVALDNGQRRFHLLHAARWYQSQPDRLPPVAVR